MREFKPRQIKTYIEKEVIGRLPNASAIDLAHFGGLNAARRKARRAGRSVWRVAGGASKLRAAHRHRSPFR
jgi:hypothetical protein